MRPTTYISIAQGIEGVAGNLLRSLLATLGVAIGVASVIATMALTDGLERYARAQIEAQTDVQSIVVASRVVEMRDGYPFPIHGYPIFALPDARELQRHLGRSAQVTMVASGTAAVRGPKMSPHVAAVTAALANYLDFGRRALDAGRFFTEAEVLHNSPVVVLSHLLARELSPTGDAAAMLDRTVRVHGRPLAVIGVLPPYLGERGYQVIVPQRAASATFRGGGPIVPSVIVRAPTLEQVDATRSAVEQWLAGRYRHWETRVTVTTSLARLRQAQQGMHLLKLVMGALAAISLVVGGVGIMNVLLASVVERTREIGVRKALGARQRDILWQFLAESVTIASVGSAVGTATGFAAAFATAWLMRRAVPEAPLYAVVTPATLAIAIVAAAVIGLAFGTFPALRAARLSPIDAIRHE